MRYLVAIALFCAQSVFAQNTRISGKILNPEDANYTVSRIAPVEFAMHMMQEQVASSSKNSSGSFILEFQIDKPTYLSFNHGTEWKTILAHPGDSMTMNANMVLFDETLVFDGTGARRNNILNNLSLVFEDIHIPYDEMKSSQDTMFVLESIDQNYNKYIRLLEDYSASIPDLKAHTQQQLKFVEEYRTEWVERVKKDMRLSTLEGEDPFNLEGIALDGKPLSLAQFRGKITVIDFWATWCGPCKAEMPSLKALEEEYGEKINFVSVAINDKIDKWKEMAPTFGLTNNMFVSKENEGPLEPLEVSSIPRYIVLDENLQIVDADAPRPSSGDLEKYFR